MRTDTSRTISWDENVNNDTPFGALQKHNYEPNSTVLLIDARMLAYASAHTRTLTTSDGTDTSVTHGIIEAVTGLCSAANTHRWCLVWDGLPSYRRELHAAYKMRQDRDRTPEEAEQHKRMLRSIEVALKALSMIGCPQAWLSRVEADDLIGVFAGMIYRHGIAKRDHPIERVVVVSEDKDYYQLIRRNNILVYRHRMGEVVDEKLLHDLYGLTPDQYLDAKALMGEPETGDNIPGVPGVGEKTARNYIAAHGNLQSLLANLRDQSKAGQLKTVRDRAVHANMHIVWKSYKLSRILRQPNELAACYSGRCDKLRSEWRRAHAELRKGVAVTRTAHVSDLVRFRARYEFDSFDPQRWGRITGFRISL